MMQEEIKSQITKALFWDVNFTEIDFNKHHKFIIPRVMDRGTKNDVKIIWDFYGEKVIRETLINTRFLEDKTIYFFANLFSIQASDFRAYQIKQNQLSTWSI